MPTRPYRRIACCIERDRAMPSVLAEADRLGDGAPEALWLVHALAPPRLVVGGPYGFVPPIVELREEAQRWLEEAAARLAGATPVLLEGYPPRAVCEWASETRPDLIVAAAHRGILDRAMLGGFAAYVAYHAPCPVMLVHPSDTSSAAPNAAAEVATAR